MRAFFVYLLLFSFSCFGQSVTENIWEPLQPFVGTWKGEGGGEPGQGTYERSYQFVMANNFIEIHNKSTYAPTAGKPNGEVHEDLGYFSYDKGRKKFVLRQFHIEGFVNQYVLDSIAPDGKTLVFVTEAIENIPKGWTAKESYKIISESEIEEVFELAPPGQEFFVYSKVKLIRQQ